MPGDPLAAVTHRDPYRYYDRLVETQPLYFDRELGLWIVAGAGFVEACLRSHDFAVRPPQEPAPATIAGTSAGDVFAQLARMTDGPAHAMSRDVIDRAIGLLPPELVEGTAREVAAELIVRPGSADGMPQLNCFVTAYPLGVVARLAGCAQPELEGVVEDALAFVAAVRPGSSPTDVGRGLVATENLIQRFDALDGPERAPLRLAPSAECSGQTAAANTLGLLMQTYEATAALIGNALVRIQVGGNSADETRIDERYLREVARYDSPVQNTRRCALQDTVLGEHRIRQGDALLLVLAAANRDPAVNPDPHMFDPRRNDARIYSWGLGAHRCPGVNLSLTIAAIGLDALHGKFGDWELLPAATGYRPLSNVRMPIFPD